MRLIDLKTNIMIKTEEISCIKKIKNMFEEVINQK